MSRNFSAWRYRVWVPVVAVICICLAFNTIAQDKKQPGTGEDLNDWFSGIEEMQKATQAAATRMEELRAGLEAERAEHQAAIKAAREREAALQTQITELSEKHASSQREVEALRRELEQQTAAMRSTAEELRAVNEALENTRREMNALRNVHAQLKETSAATERDLFNRVKELEQQMQAYENERAALMARAEKGELAEKEAAEAIVRAEEEKVLVRQEAERDIQLTRNILDEARVEITELKKDLKLKEAGLREATGLLEAEKAAREKADALRQREVEDATRRMAQFEQAAKEAQAQLELLNTEHAELLKTYRSAEKTAAKEIARLQETLEKERKGHKKELALAEEQVAEQKKEQARSAEELAQAQKAVDELRAQVKKFTSEEKALRERIAGVEQQVDAQQKQLKTAEQEKSVAIARAEELHAELKQQGLSLSEVTKERDTARKEAAAAEKKMAAMQAAEETLQESMEKMRESWSAKLEEMEKSLSVAAVTIKDLKVQLEQEREQHAGSKNQVVELTGQLDGARSRNESLEASMKEALDLVAQWKGRLTESEQKLENTSAELADVRSALQEKEKECAALEAARAQAEAEFRQRIAELQEIPDGLNRELVKVRGDLEVERRAHETTKQNLNAAIEEMKGRIAAVEAVAAEEAVKRQEAERAVAEVTQKLEIALSGNRLLDEKLDRAGKELARMNDTYSKLRKSTEETKGDLMSQIEALRANMEEVANEEVRRLKEAYWELQERADATRIKLEERVEELEKMPQTSVVKVEELEAKVAQLMQEQARLEEDASRQLEIMRKRTEKLENDLSHAEALRQQAEENLAIYREQFERYINATMQFVDGIGNK